MKWYASNVQEGKHMIRDMMINKQKEKKDEEGKESNKEKIKEINKIKIEDIIQMVGKKEETEKDMREMENYNTKDNTIYMYSDGSVHYMT